MKPYDKRRLNAFILDEEHASLEYQKMGMLMEEQGYMGDAKRFYEMADDEAEHAETIRHMIANTPEHL